MTRPVRRLLLVGGCAWVTVAAVAQAPAADARRPLEGNTMPHTALPGFDDAVAALLTTLDAEAGRPAAHRLTPSTEGAVRVVGTVQKRSAAGAAEVRVLAAGQPVWTCKLPAGDAIRHGFDVVAYDLTKDSPVELVVEAAAASPRVQVSAALQVVREPFVSRWRADLPDGFPRFTDGEKQVLRERGQAVLQQLRDASAARRGRFVIPPGDYLMHARWSQVSTLKDLADLEIIADGVTFWFEPPMIHALLFEHCRNVTVRGLTIDFTRPCWLQARVTAIDRERKTVRADLMPGYAPLNAEGHGETEGQRAFMFYDAGGRFINHRHTPGKWRLSADGASVVCSPTLSGIPAALQPGDYLVGTIRTGAALRSVNCAGMRFEDVNIWSSPGMAVYEGGGAGGHVYRRVRATRRPHTNRLQAFGADIFHLAGADRGPTLERCELAYGADDNLNIHGSFGRVVQRVDERHYYLEGAYQPGDKLEFRDATSLSLLGLAQVTTAASTPDGPALAINATHKAKGEYLVELATPLALPPLALVVLDGKRSAAGFVLRGCWLHDNFQRTLINGSPGGLIENVTLQNVGHGLCIQFETWGPWMEGPFARDLVVRHNRFLDCPPTGPALAVTMHPPGGGSDRRRFEARPVTNLTIAGNTFSRTDGVTLAIHNVDGLRLQDNSVDRAAPPGDTSRWLYLQDCANVAVEHNLTPPD